MNGRRRRRSQTRGPDTRRGAEKGATTDGGKEAGSAEGAGAAEGAAANAEAAMIRTKGSKTHARVAHTGRGAAEAGAATKTKTEGDDAPTTAVGGETSSTGAERTGADATAAETADRTIDMSTSTTTDAGMMRERRPPK